MENAPASSGDITYLPSAITKLLSHFVGAGSFEELFDFVGGLYRYCWIESEKLLPHAFRLRVQAGSLASLGSAALSAGRKLLFIDISTGSV
jgi:hypothetical protein